MKITYGTPSPLAVFSRWLPAPSKRYQRSFNCCRLYATFACRETPGAWNLDFLSRTEWPGYALDRFSHDHFYLLQAAYAFATDFSWTWDLYVPGLPRGAVPSNFLTHR